MLHILIADDHALVRKGLKQILSGSGITSVVSEARNGAEALEMGLAHPWDIIILDITMPFENGLNVLKKLMSTKPDLRVIMLSMHTNPVYAKHALKAGAAGYLSKESASDELLEAISKVLAGQTYVCQSLRNLPDTGDLPPWPESP